jgi:hypothetical protein
MRGTALVLASLLLLSAGLAWSQDGGTAALLAACDQVAAAPFDPNWPAGVAGIAGEKKRKPKLVGSLYLRGLARQKRGDAAGGNDDIASAKAIEPDIAERYKRYGIN